LADRISGTTVMNRPFLERSVPFLALQGALIPILPAHTTMVRHPATVLELDSQYTVPPYLLHQTTASV
jgi:hypothetical protein